ncbi:MAG: tRNA (cytidine(34)-2'-O)-methyltransferase [Verrucomicrobia bacterium]|nr:tRNA (cytidine(34)-2'-O)-methyltransferase [Verrucomicrobiota bacterium]
MFHVVLVEPEIPANTGNVARLCAATRSILHLVRPYGFRLDEPSLRRAGMDYLDMAVIREHDSLRECIAGVASIYYLSTKSSTPYWSAGFLPGDYLVFGRETKGLPEFLLRTNSDRALTIPMEEDRARSLNLATSVAIVLYEAIRQNRGSIGVNRQAPV